MAKYHINSNGDAKPCSATKRPCRFDASDHFASKEEAQKGAEVKLAAGLKKREADRAKRVLPRTISFGEEGLTAEEKADLMVFEAMKEPEFSFSIGETDDSRFYGSGDAARISPELLEELQDHGVNVNDRTRTLHPDTFASSYELVPGSLVESSTSHFSDTYSEADQVVHLEARVVLTLHDGHRLVTPVTSVSSFREILDRALMSTPQGVLAARANKSLYGG